MKPLHHVQCVSKWSEKVGYMLIWHFSKTTSDSVELCTDNVLNVSDCSVEKLASPDKILESKTSCIIEKIDIYINNVYVPHHRHHIEGTDGLLCLRKTQAMWGKRTGFEAVTTRSCPELQPLPVRDM